MEPDGIPWASHSGKGGRDQGKAVKGKREVGQGYSQGFPRVPVIGARLCSDRFAVLNLNSSVTILYLVVPHQWFWKLHKDSLWVYFISQ